MPGKALDFDQISPGLAIWQNYDPAVKADLFSTAITTRQGTFLVDPIPLAEAALASLAEVSAPKGVIVTNTNHWRAASQFADRFALPVFAHPDSFPDSKAVVPIGAGDRIGDGLEVIAIEGAAAGEIALRYSNDGGTLIMGDALINFEPYGFTFLPGKYCSNEEEMHRSLHQLLDQPVERILFAHGLPILSKATARLRHLLDA